MTFSVITATYNAGPTIADCLFTAVSTDTGSFQYPTTQPGTYHVAGELVRRGANLARICNEVYQSYPVSRARLLKHVYSHFRLTHQDQIAYFWLKKADFARTGSDSSDSEGRIDHIRAIAIAARNAWTRRLTPDPVHAPGTPACPAAHR